MKTTLIIRGRAISTIDLARALLSFGFGAFMLIFHLTSILIISWGLAALLFIDGALDLLLELRLRLDRSHIWIGLGDMALGIITFLNSRLTVGLLVLAAAGFELLQGVGGLWRSLRQPDTSQRGAATWVRAVGSVFFAVALLLLAKFLVILAYVALGIYLLFDGGSRLWRIFAPGPVHSASSEMLTQLENDSDIIPSDGLRAVVFLRRNGAMGLGHVGWAFEWRTGWFNAGSVENVSGRAFARPDVMDFWTLHTLDPVSAMQRQLEPYDEYKIFTVTAPNPRDAWGAVVWVSRTPYSVVRHNCADCVYDVLRTYGLPGMVDTAQLNAPKDWYDALPATTIPIAVDPNIAVRPQALARLLPGAPTYIALHIHPSEQGIPPAWRLEGGRVWYVASQKIEIVVQSIVAVLRTARAAILRRRATAAEPSATVPPMTTARARPPRRERTPVAK